MYTVGADLILLRRMVNPFIHNCQFYNEIQKNETKIQLINKL